MRGSAVCLRSFDFENRSDNPDGRELVGYAARFDSPTKIRDNLGEFEETITAGAFKESIARRMPVLQFDHGKDPKVGTAPIGDITELREDRHGLFVRAELYDHPDIERVRLAIRGGSLRGMSFRFTIPDGGDHWSKRDGMDVREIRAADVAELGPVVFPAYDTTSVSVRSLLAQVEPYEFDHLVRAVAEQLRTHPDLAGLLAARSSGSGEPRTTPGTTTSGDVTAPQPHLRQRLDDGALRARGILL